MTYNEAVRELYYWQYSNTGCFNNMLFDLMQKADRNNLEKIAVGFPNEVAAFIDWNKADDYGNELFRDHGLMK